MVMRWCGFSVRALVVGVSALSLYMMSQPGRAQEPAEAETAPVTTVDDHLPVLTLEVLDPSKSVRVGDTLSVRGSGVPGLGPYTVEAPVGDDGMVAQGYDVEPLDPSESTAGNLKFSVVPIKPGNIEVGPLVIKSITGDIVARTAPLALKIVNEGSADDPKASEPEPPRPPVRMKFPFWVAVVLVLLVILAIAGLFYYMIKMGKKPKAEVLPEVPAVIRPEDQLALEALSALAEQRLMEAGQFKLHFFTLSEILKRYIGARYRFEAAESTTAEMMAKFREWKSLGERDFHLIGDLFTRLDLVKFTDYVPELGEGRRALDEARQFVLDTRRVVPTPSLLPPNVSPPNPGGKSRAL